MSTNHHNPLTGVIANLYTALNAIFSSLDGAITTNTADIATNTANIATNTADIATLQATPGGTVVPGTVQGRLSLSSTEPTPTGDISGATTLYFLPYRGELVALYDGTSDWEYHNIPSAGVSISIPATTTTNYDVYLYDNSGTLALELVAWTNATTRATALATQDGVRVKSGDASRLYLGMMRTTGISGECQDSAAARYVANYYNRISKPLLQQLSGNHTYATNAFRAFNDDANNCVHVLVHADRSLWLEAHLYVINQLGITGIGVDSSTVDASMINMPGAGASADLFAKAVYAGTPAEGYHQFIILQKGSGGTATTFFGSSTAGTQSGLIGEVYV
jgi:hypothetical protein